MNRLFDAVFPMRGWPIALIIVLTQFIASNVVNIMGYPSLARLYPLFATRKIEKDGKIYQTIFHIKGWKEFIPSVSSFNKKSIEKKRITQEYVQQYLLEGVRAELCHVLAVFFALIVLLCSVPSSWFFIIAYTLLFNIPCIVIQRYNRPRFQHLAKEKDDKGRISFTLFLESQKREKRAREEKKEEAIEETTKEKSEASHLEVESSEVQEEGE